MMLPNKGSTVRTAAWALSNLIKGPNPKAATELIRVDGLLDALVRHLRKADDELATEVAWVVVYLSAFSNLATSMLVESGVLQLLVQRLAMSNSLQLLILSGCTSSSFHSVHLMFYLIYMVVHVPIAEAFPWPYFFGNFVPYVSCVGS
ncbi:hypothetical protein EV2_033393 [Malus domestica]